MATPPKFRIDVDIHSLQMLCTPLRDPSKLLLPKNGRNLYSLASLYRMNRSFEDLHNSIVRRANERSSVHAQSS